MGWYPHEGDLVSPEAKGNANLRLELVEKEAIDEPVTGSAHASRAVHHLRDHPSVTSVKGAVSEDTCQDQVGIAPIEFDAGERPECNTS